MKKFRLLGFAKRPWLPVVLILGILLIAGFFRLYRIADFTEFLGDQGRAYVDVYEYWNARIIPLIGPTVSSGQKPGPFYYYLIAPSLVVSRFNPVAPAVLFALLGVVAVYLMFYLTRLLYGFSVGIAVAAVYALSPAVIRFSRNAWNPSAVPLLILLVLVSLYRVYQGKIWFIVLLGFSCGILVQLHYSTVYTVGFSVIVLAGLLVREGIKRGSFRNWLRPLLAGVGAFLLPLVPFIYYEVTHAFRDIVGVFFFWQQSTSVGVRRLTALVDTMTLTGHVVGFALPVTEVVGFALVGLFVFWAILKKRDPVILALLTYFIGGLLFMGLIIRQTFDHYLFFLLPVPFLFIGAVLGELKRKKPVILYLAVVSAIAVAQMTRLDVFRPQLGDIERTQGVTREMLRQTEGKQFSFALISSMSFSDYHYRFFLARAGRIPLSIYDDKADIMFLVCERAPCLTVPYVENMKKTKVLCFERDCRSEYPDRALDGWAFAHIEELPDAKIYTFTKRNRI